ncbi:MAG TPA: ribosome recycling factor [Bryobacteraceae bacterium]|nr:ribosome recycling factor [Bryobacteraceae bacterium]
MKAEPSAGASPKTTKDITNNAKSRMEKVIADLQHAAASLRTGRASVNLLDSVTVDYYGQATPINQLATLHVPEPFLITIQPWDAGQIGMIEKAIRNSDLGLNPGNDGKIIRVPIPQLTEERRREFVKKLQGIAEDHRVGLRNVRRDANEQVKKLLKDKLISEDDDKRTHDEIQKLTDSYIQKIDQLAKTKEKEIMEIK